MLGLPTSAAPVPAFSRLRRILSSEKRIFYPIIFYAVLVSLFSLIVPVAVQSVVNSVALGSLTQQLILLSLIVFLVLAFSGGLTSLQLYAVEVLQRRLFARYSLEYAYRIPRLEELGLGKIPGPELVNPFLEITIVHKAVAGLMLGGLGLILQIAVGLILLALYHPVLLAFSLGLVFSIFVVFFVFGKGGVRSADEECSAKYEVLMWLEDMARMPKVFRSTTGEQFGLRHADQEIAKWLDKRRSHFAVLLRQNIAIYVIQAVASSALLGLGGLLVMRGQLSLGQLVAAELIVNAALSGLAKFGKHLESFYDLLASIKKLHQIIDLPLEDQEASGELICDEKALSLEIRNLSLSSPSRDSDMILKNVSMSLEPGSSSIIVGEGGSGKSILVDCIYGMIESYSGSILINSLNIKDVSARSLRENVLLVGENSLFRGTLEDNIRLGYQDCSEKELRRIFDAIDLGKKIDSLPNGLRTVVYPHSTVFSSSELSRLALVRAIASRPKFLIVDQVLDAIDDQHLKMSLALVNSLTPGTTVLVTATDRSLLSEPFDHKYILTDGLITVADDPGTWRV